LETPSSVNLVLAMLVVLVPMAGVTVG
jgi:hypothetical protein